MQVATKITKNSDDSLKNLSVEHEGFTKAAGLALNVEETEKFKSQCWKCSTWNKIYT
jgi:hypothetical protein